ncbi:hypothetical protein LTR02_014838 [Friedmanniomyces endolithicus]|nr:hypothetical protein LTS09_003441 [Friedmanniomyces endolithicus]KAK0774838.1 hypothetical protein LTR38_016073 [Friedmanniomyces endolithicus]KAK0793690.1 hypothetical protein LTR59_008056 [Friedmanniomyces endolithicus]KAK0830219.1 hypothetical protein LTR03_015896 [Friedmanniomyces endolithicus]KAK0855043.1 hypothetical protein LTS02_011245 [Friedmanniomyces endolithicus]
MPHLFSFAGHSTNETLQDMDHDRPHKQPSRRPSLLKNIGSLWKRHHDQQRDAEPIPQTAPPEPSPPSADYFGPTRRRSWQDHSVGSRPRRAIPSLPRPQTFRRQESERRERLLEVEPSPTEKRALSADRFPPALGASAARRPLSPIPFPFPLRSSAPDVNASDQQSPLPSESQQSGVGTQKPSRSLPNDLPPLQIPEHNDEGPLLDDDRDEHAIDQVALRDEYDRRWILNLSMHFRDKSNREKFFVTFADKPNRWRRVTVSLDYRDAPHDSLEADLNGLHYQRDKSFRIYEAIRESLAEIQYYDTVTNLKLETTREDGQLHVHVREDANEIVQYPAISLFQHVQTRRYRESQLEFVSHISGFVYKVIADGAIVIKKEIPGPDTVDEFLYEVNALAALVDCDDVVQLEGLVTDDCGSCVKGLLISYATKGALVDLLYDLRGAPELHWYRREKWARQIVQGLADIHEAGFVQGDFTLSNIVIDADDNALIIDINRRGCPVGWEPPELGRLIDSGQRIGMHIGVKTDLWQLGMVFWALAEECDEPERVERPLPPLMDTVPSYFGRIIDTCLSTRPQGRIDAKKLLRLFPPAAGRSPSRRRRSADFMQPLHPLNDSVSTHRSDKEYIDPDMAVTLDEVRRRRLDTDPASDFTSGQVTYVDPDSNPESVSYRFESSGSWVVGHRRGRSPVSSRRRRSSPYGRTVSSATSVSREPPSRGLPRGSSCDETREVVGDDAVTMGYPPSICGDDLVAVPGMTGAGEDLTGQHEPATFSRENSDRRLHAVHSADFTRLMHTDSGFDEHMVDELTLDDTIVPGISHTTNSTNMNAYDTGEKTAFLHEREELPMSDSVCTPLASSPMAVERKSEGRQEQQRDYDS